MKKKTDHRPAYGRSSVRCDRSDQCICKYSGRSIIGDAAEEILAGGSNFDPPDDDYIAVVKVARERFRNRHQTRQIF
mgnify:CR=1 FL=1